jgi:hypothetical protein
LRFSSFPNVHWRHWEPGFYHYLSDAARAQFEAWDALFFAEFDLIAKIFHAIINKGTDVFQAGLDQLHPSPQEQMVCIVMLSKLSRALYRLKHTDTPPASLWGNGRDMVYLGTHFTPEQTEILWKRFGTLNQKLKNSDQEDHPGFQRSMSKYDSDNMPTDFEVADFIASWDNT